MNKLVSFLKVKAELIKFFEAFLRVSKRGIALYFLLTIFLFLPSSTRANQAPPPENIIVKSLYSAVENNQPLYHLIFGIHPNVMIEADSKPYIFKNVGEPVQAFCDINEINSLYADTTMFQAVRILHLYNVKNGNIPTLDLTQMTAFENLEYIYIAFNYNACEDMSENCLPNIIRNFIIPNNKKITVLYKLDLAH
ncbi:MAG: hypothetical protein LBI45_03630 [Bacteroidales bacterium]|jgi:hypothetical protein|nr:hypothetical protein [Bacteroidales bacterium]